MNNFLYGVFFACHPSFRNAQKRNHAKWYFKKLSLSSFIAKSWYKISLLSSGSITFTKLLHLACERAYLWDTRASGEQQSDPGGRSLVSSLLVGYASPYTKTSNAIVGVIYTARIQAIMKMNWGRFRRCIYMYTHLRLRIYKECVAKESPSSRVFMVIKTP